MSRLNIHIIEEMQLFSYYCEDVIDNYVSQVSWRKQEYEYTNSQML